MEGARWEHLRVAWSNAVGKHGSRAIAHASQFRSPSCSSVHRLHYPAANVQVCSTGQAARVSITGQLACRPEGLCTATTCASHHSTSKKAGASGSRHPGRRCSTLAFGLQQGLEGQGAARQLSWNWRRDCDWLEAEPPGRQQRSKHAAAAAPQHSYMPTVGSGRQQRGMAGVAATPMQQSQPSAPSSREGRVRVAHHLPIDAALAGQDGGPPLLFRSAGAVLAAVPTEQGQRGDIALQVSGCARLSTQPQWLHLLFRSARDHTQRQQTAVAGSTSPLRK